MGDGLFEPFCSRPGCEWIGEAVRDQRAADRQVLAHIAREHGRVTMPAPLWCEVHGTNEDACLSAYCIAGRLAERVPA